MKGKDLISKARALAVNTPQEKISRAFFERHEKIALLKLPAFKKPRENLIRKRPY
jgi:hypothetical protein